MSRIIWMNMNVWNYKWCKWIAVVRLLLHFHSTALVFIHWQCNLCCGFSNFNSYVQCQKPTKETNNKTLTIKTQGPVFATNPSPVVYDGQPHEIRTTGARSAHTERNLAGSGHPTLLQLVPAFNCSILRWRWLIVRDNGEVAFLRTNCPKANIGRIHYIDKRLLDSLCVGQKPPSLYIVCTENQSLQSWRSRYKTLYWKKLPNYNIH